MYITYNNFTGTLQDGEVLLLSLEEMIAHKEEIKGLPICVTKDGSEPKELNVEQSTLR